jgi:hypothetical protein
MPSNKLTQLALRAAMPRDKPYKLGDGDGLYLLVNPNGSRWWRLKYHFEAREKLLSLGVYPHVTLQHARSLRDEAKRAIVNGVDPSVKKQIEKSAHSNTSEAVAREWLTLQEKTLASATFAKAVWTFETAGALRPRSTSPLEAGLGRLERLPRQDKFNRGRAIAAPPDHDHECLSLCRTNPQESAPWQVSASWRSSA